MRHHPPLVRTLTAVVAAASFTVAAVAAPSDDSSASIEYAVKAAYLYKFAPFVQWPETARTGSFVICIVGADPFGSILDTSVANQKISNRPIAVQRHADAGTAENCDVAYIARTARQSLSAIGGRPVLTVTDDAESPEQRGVIHFIVRDNRVRFEIDEAAAAHQGLAISSKLLNLAVPATGGRAR